MLQPLAQGCEAVSLHGTFVWHVCYSTSRNTNLKSTWRIYMVGLYSSGKGHHGGVQSLFHLHSFSVNTLMLHGKQGSSSSDSWLAWLATTAWRRVAFLNFFNSVLSFQAPAPQRSLNAIPTFKKMDGLAQQHLIWCENSLKAYLQTNKQSLYNSL